MSNLGNTFVDTRFPRPSVPSLNESDTANTAADPDSPGPGGPSNPSNESIVYPKWRPECSFPGRKNASLRANDVNALMDKCLLHLQSCFNPKCDKIPFERGDWCFEHTCLYPGCSVGALPWIRSENLYESSGVPFCREHYQKLDILNPLSMDGEESKEPPMLPKLTHSAQRSSKEPQLDQPDGNAGGRSHPPKMVAGK